MYSIKKVSQLLGIPAVTIRAWENRYKVISPIRTEGGHRLYTNKDINTLKWLKEQVQINNVKISDAVRLLSTSTQMTPNEVRTSGQGYDEMKSELYQALIHFDTQEANRITDLAFSLYHYEEVLHHILVQVLYQIGEDWEQNAITVAQEHFSTQYIMNRCHQFTRIFTVNPVLPKVLAFCPEGELHHIGLMLFSLFLRKKGHDVIYLGPNTPLSSLLELINIKNISIVAISITNPRLLETVEKWIESCLQRYPTLKFVIGGYCINHSEYNTKSISYLTDLKWEEWYQSL